MLKRKANEIKVPMVISIVDEGGNFVACHRMDDALLVSVELAQNKAVDFNSHENDDREFGSSSCKWKRTLWY